MYTDIFIRIRTYIQDEISLYNLSFIYANMSNGVSDVSQKTEINVKDFYLDNNKYYITTINNEVRLPFRGLITQKQKNIIKYEVAYDVVFYIYLDKTNVILYESLSKNEIIGYSEVYQIWSNNIANLSLLNYTKIYDEA